MLEYIYPYPSLMNYQPIFDYIDKSLKIIKQEIIAEITTEIRAEFQPQFDILIRGFDTLSRETKEFRQEQIVSGHRIDRLEDWAKPAGDKLGLPISF